MIRELDGRWWCRVHARFVSPMLDPRGKGDERGDEMDNQGMLRQSILFAEEI
jgi:hypothetical protein